MLCTMIILLLDKNSLVVLCQAYAPINVMPAGGEAGHGVGI